jgi:hypothetical protein
VVPHQGDHPKRNLPGASSGTSRSRGAFRIELDDPRAIRKLPVENQGPEQTRGLLLIRDE